MSIERNTVHVAQTNKCTTVLKYLSTVHTHYHTIIQTDYYFKCWCELNVNWEKKGKSKAVYSADSRTVDVLAGSKLPGVDSVLVINVRVRGMAVKCAVYERVCVCVANGVRVNWCCVLKGVNKAAEHPRSSRKMCTHTHTHTHTNTHTHRGKLYNSRLRWWVLLGMLPPWFHFRSEVWVEMCDGGWWCSKKSAKKTCLTLFYRIIPFLN